MKKQCKTRKLRLTKETVANIVDLLEGGAVGAAGSANRICAGYTVLIGPCVPTQMPLSCFIAC